MGTYHAFISKPFLSKEQEELIKSELDKKSVDFISFSQEGRYFHGYTKSLCHFSEELWEISSLFDFVSIDNEGGYSVKMEKQGKIQ